MNDVNVKLIRSFLNTESEGKVSVDPAAVKARIKSMHEEAAALRQTLALVADEAEARQELETVREIFAAAIPKPPAERLAELEANPPGFWASKASIRAYEAERLALKAQL